MRRLTLEQKEDLGSRIREGQSLNRMSRELSLSKTTIYYWYRKAKGKTQPYTAPHYTSNSSREEGESLGIFAGDGCYGYGRKKRRFYGTIACGLKNREYIMYVQKLYTAFFHREFKIRKGHATLLTLRLRGKVVYDYFHQKLEFDNTYKAYTVHLKPHHYPREFLEGFLKGLIDTDGTVYLNHSTLSIRFYTSSLSLRNQICVILNSLGFNYRLNADVRNPQHPNFHISLRNKDDCKRFLELVHPCKGKRINGTARI
jgi:hypothetical protein